MRLSVPDASAHSLPAPTAATVPLSRAQTRRVREVYRSAGWPCQDMLEIELLAAGLLQRVNHTPGHAMSHETLRLTDAGIACLATSLAGNRFSLFRHEALVGVVADSMARAGRITWRGLALRARLDPTNQDGPVRWCMVKPDVFSIRNTSVAAYVDPIVHEIKVNRSDLLGDLRRPEKRAAYLDLGGECWYVLGADAKGRPIGAPDEVPLECGVMLLEKQRLVVARAAPRRARADLPFGVWLALAKATPLPNMTDSEQMLLGQDAPDNG